MRRSFHFDRPTLLELAAARRAEYQAARPFPHVVFDEFAAKAALEDVLSEFPSAEHDAWWRFDSDNERKLASRPDTELGEATRQLLAELHSATFTDFLQELTGISGLVVDPHLEGGGLHQIQRGGHLNVHVDFNRHPATGLDRRLNVLLYLNPGWEPAWGGALELWSSDMRRCEKSIAPLFNRLVVFSTTRSSFHGHPEPLACPPDRSRRSLALYYYSNGRPEDGNTTAPTHNTLWEPPRESADPADAARERAKAVARRVTPPILIDAVRAARRRSRA
jgi:Rps23 Pro-64 3,4-dihydroxylase Tpa1-like proline 4-hydroxylase